MLILFGVGYGRECKKSGFRVYCVGRYEGEEDLDVTIREWDMEWCGFGQKARLYSRGIDCGVVQRLCGKMPLKLNDKECEEMVSFPFIYLFILKIFFKFIFIIYLFIYLFIYFKKYFHNEAFSYYRLPGR